MSDLTAPVMRLVNQLEQSVRKAFIDEVIIAANAGMNGNRLCMPGTTWIAAGEK